VLCIPTVYIMTLRFEYRVVLKNWLPSVLRDTLQLMLSVGPIFIFLVGTPRSPIKYLNPYDKIQATN